MNRRKFITTSAGIVAAAAGPECWALENRSSTKRSFDFAEYKDASNAVPIQRITPDDGYYIHTYYDVSPWSPSGRYLAATKVPYQDRYPVLGDTAEVCLIDLKDRTIQTLFQTKSWGYQTGANVNWGATDRYLYTNDIINGVSVCVRIDLERGETRIYTGPAYNVAPDDSCVIGFPMELMDATQLGYGAPSKDPLNPPSLPLGASKTQGLWRTDLKTGKKTLLMSLHALASQVKDAAPWKGTGTWYLWHSKFNPQSNRILQISRVMFPDRQGGENSMVFTFNPDGSDLTLLPVKKVWGNTGGHPNWHADGRHVIRVLPVDGKLRFVQWRSDGSDFRLLSETLEGGGHPRIQPDGRYLITDTFTHDGTKQYMVLRFIDFREDRERPLCRIGTVDRSTLNDPLSMVRRLDGHPNWDRNFKKVIFQAAPEGRRQLYLADLTNLL
ncbi:MAG: hypothetical protein IT170_10105 [Bryobacterales bacterium]|nr:hypothetical protein [Bryobacterales bacterium]